MTEDVRKLLKQMKGDDALIPGDVPSMFKHPTWSGPNLSKAT